MRNLNLNPSSSLIDLAGLSPELQHEVKQADDKAWIEVIQSMDTIYADLVKYQVKLEEKNSELEGAYDKLHQAHEELKTAQLQLIQAEKMASLGRLVAGVAHELNNPISFLYANMHALQSYEKKIRSYLNVIHQNASKKECEKLRQELKIDYLMDDMTPLIEGSLEGAERTNDIVKNLRKFVTPQQTTWQSFDVIEVLKRATTWVLNAANNKPNIICDYPASLMINNSEGHVHQILINLIQNSLDAMDEQVNPCLNICVYCKNKLVNICIKDNGHGIKQADLVKIFDPFFTTKPVGRGTGLGLYISYGLAQEQCRGALNVHSIESGAEFILSLPE